jgi:hypothetical protein
VQENCLAFSPVDHGNDDRRSILNECDLGDQALVEYAMYGSLVVNAQLPQLTDLVLFGLRV